MTLTSSDITMVVGFLIGSFCLGYTSGYLFWLFKKATEQI